MYATYTFNTYNLILRVRKTMILQILEILWSQWKKNQI